LIAEVDFDNLEGASRRCEGGRKLTRWLGRTLRDREAVEWESAKRGRDLRVRAERGERAGK